MKPWRHLLLLTHSSAWSALTLCPWNNTTVRYTALRLTLHDLSAHKEGEDAPAVPLHPELCDSAVLFLDALNSSLLSFIKSVCAPLQPRPYYHLWVMSSLLQLLRWLCQQRGLWELLVSSSGPPCTWSSLLHSFSQGNGVSLWASASLKLSHVLSNYFIITEQKLLFFPNYFRPKAETSEARISHSRHHSEEGQVQ